MSTSLLRPASLHIVTAGESMAGFSTQATAVQSIISEWQSSHAAEMLRASGGWAQRLAPLHLSPPVQ